VSHFGKPAGRTGLCQAQGLFGPRYLRIERPERRYLGTRVRGWYQGGPFVLPAAGPSGQFPRRASLPMTAGT